MKLSFELRKEKITSNGLIPIQVVIRANGIRIRKNIGVSTKEEYWNGSRIKPNLKREENNNYQFINDELQKVEAKVNDIFFFFRANRIEFTKELFLEKFNLDTSKLIPDIDFFICFDEYLEVGKLTKGYNTIKGQNKVKNFILEFQNIVNYKISFNSINNSFFEELMKYAFFSKQIKNNYFAKIIKVLKSFLRWANDRGYHDNRDFEKFKAPEHDIDIIYLTFDELMQLYEYDFGCDRLNHAKDIYCMGCFTSLRYSDLNKLHLANISETHINLSIQKTKTQNHNIRLNKYSKEILDRYRNTIYEPLPNISAQKLNQYIKECCKIAGIDEFITITKYVGSKKVFIKCPKYELITTHTARKTFITNSLLLGMEPKAIKEIANIKKDTVLNKYLKITETYTDKQMDKAWN